MRARVALFVFLFGCEPHAQVAHTAAVQAEAPEDDPVLASWRWQAEHRHVRIAVVHPSHVDRPVTDHEIDEWIAAHREELEREAVRDTYVEPQRRLRTLVVREEEDAGARERLTAARRRLDAGEDFAALARELSDDPTSAILGGDMGWVTEHDVLPELATAAFAATIGSVVELHLPSQRTYLLVRVEAERSGQLEEAVVRREIAERRLRRELREGAARRCIEAVLPVLRSGAPAEAVRARLDASCPLHPRDTSIRVREVESLVRDELDHDLVGTSTAEYGYEIVDAAFDAELADPVIGPLELTNAVVALRLIAIHPPAPPPRPTAEERRCMERRLATLRREYPEIASIRDTHERERARFDVCPNPGGHCDRCVLEDGLGSPR